MASKLDPLGYAIHIVGHICKAEVIMDLCGDCWLLFSLRAKLG